MRNKESFSDHTVKCRQLTVTIGSVGVKRLGAVWAVGEAVLAAVHPQPRLLTSDGALTSRPRLGAAGFLKHQPRFSNHYILNLVF